MRLNYYGEQLRAILLKHGLLATLAYQIALNLQERSWVPYSSVASTPTAQAQNFEEH